MRRHSLYPMLRHERPALPRTRALSRALDSAYEHTAIEDLRFLEAFECHAIPDIAAALRAQQIRRANPLLAAELRAELALGRPLTIPERAALAQTLRV
jgi:hypothetical protein